MLPNELVGELHKLSRAEKLHAMQILISDLAAEENALLSPGTPYPVYTPYGNEQAAAVLLEALKIAGEHSS